MASHRLRQPHLGGALGHRDLADGGEQRDPVGLGQIGQQRPIGDGRLEQLGTAANVVDRESHLKSCMA